MYDYNDPVTPELEEHHKFMMCRINGIATEEDFREFIDFEGHLLADDIAEYIHEYQKDLNWCLYTANHLFNDYLKPVLGQRDFLERHILPDTYPYNSILDLAKNYFELLHQSKTHSFDFQS